MQQGLIILLYKKGPAELLDNYRPITLVNKVQSVLAATEQLRWRLLMATATRPDHSKWRPATPAAFAKRWARLCTRVNGNPDFHELIETPRDTSP